MKAKQETNHEAQQRLRAEICDAHGLDPEQVTFVGDGLVPVFDFEALSYLALKLTDIQNIECSTARVDTDLKFVTADCVVTIPDGRTRKVSSSAMLGEVILGGGTIETLFQAEAVAHARATRRGIRAVGINLMKAHREWQATGNPTISSGERDPKLALYQEAHILASKVGLIKGSDRSQYEALIAANFDGRTSTRDLDASELDMFINILRHKERKAGH